MATLEQLGVTFGVGCGVLAGTLGLFAGALRLRITHIAPRCEARPRNVIYHPTAAPRDSLEASAIQNRGNPLWGWIFWIVQLSYPTLIEGVPGTGTRNDGVDGHLLKLNLDAIVMLRFHALGLRITSFAMFLYCGVALPVYFTSRCFDAPFDSETGIVENCTLDASYNLTRYERLTLANVPALNQAHLWDSTHHMVNFRLYLIVVCTYVVAWYTCYELQKEWVDLLAMRRVYYLEDNIWKARREELKATMLYDHHDSEDHHDSHDSQPPPSSPSNSYNNNPPQNNHYTDDNPHLHKREAWIPHPEQRDTPPNIGLYSVLVGGLPKRPRQAVTAPDQDLEAAQQNQPGGQTNHGKLDWQLSVTSAFFDYCVPNQPGFTSSVAAVTILPSAREMATAWKKWYGATKKLQRLRFIRRQLLERGFRKEDNNKTTTPHPSNGTSPHNNINNNHSNDDSERVQVHPENDFDIYLRSSSRRHQYTHEVLGDVTDDDVEAMFLKSLQMGPEQTAVYSLELARGSSKCCPHGCCEEKILFSPTRDLLQMEAEAVADAHQAFSELEVLRKKAVLERHDGPDSEEPDPASGGGGHRHTNSKRTKVLDLVEKVGVPTTTTSQSDITTADASIETRLFGNGQAALNHKNSNASSRRRGKRSKSKSAKVRASAITNPSSLTGSTNGEPNHDDPLLETKPAANGRGPAALSRPRLHTEDSSYFPSMIRMVPSTGTPNGNGTEHYTSQGAFGEEVNRWQAVRQVANECERSARSSVHPLMDHRVSDGIWHRPSLRLLWGDFWQQSCGMIAWTWKSSQEATDLYARDSTYAVVTFTSRQAAIAARKCLADGRGAGKWITVDDVPVPPLADASAFNICDCRGCCRPVTVTLNDHQKIMRNYIAWILVLLIYVFYTFPITFAATYGSEQFTELFPSLEISQESLYGFIRAQLLNLFLAVCPHMFLFLANFGSNATSMVEAEFAALQYYWWFFLLFALLGSSIAQMVLSTFKEGSLRFGDTLQRVAATIPVLVSSTWCNWIILKALILHPLFYLLQLHSFVFSCLRLKCCLRLVRGGGAGNRVPYRWYVESGMVLMFALALAPAAPILSPFAVLYFIVSNPILRHVLIFTYKPQFDGGGIRWPFLFDACISSLLVSQILLGTMLALKKAVGPAVAASLLAIPTMVFRRTARRRFLQAYRDAALLQTSLLDGWDTTTEDDATRTMEGREEFRQFLVDAHKAAYVPVCVAGTNTDKIMTAEPAVVVPATTDTDYTGFSSNSLPPSLARSPFAREISLQYSDEDPLQSFRNSQQQQVGAVMRRNWMGSSTGTSVLQRTDTSSPSSVAKRNVSSTRSGDSSDGPSIKISSLGLIREGENGEKTYLFDELDAQKKR